MYFGSVRFFKNLILLVVIVLIAVPTVMAVRYHKELVLVSDELETIIEVPSDEQPDESPESSESTTKPKINVDVPAYQKLYPDFYAPQSTEASERVEGTIYLTFDDGPSSRTPEILSILAEKDVKATFFVVGATNGGSLQYMKDIIAQGHTLGMHSYSHKYDQIYASVEDYLDDMYQIFTLIKETTGQTPTVFRFPGGSINAYNSGIYRELIAEMLRRGFVPYDWNLSSMDASNKKVSASEIIENVVGPAANVSRGFVLMHDAASKETTVQALGPMIDRLRTMGFQFSSITPKTAPTMFCYVE